LSEHPLREIHPLLQVCKGSVSVGEVVDFAPQPLGLFPAAPQLGDLDRRVADDSSDDDDEDSRSGQSLRLGLGVGLSRYLWAATVYGLSFPRPAISLRVGSKQAYQRWRCQMGTSSIRNLRAAAVGALIIGLVGCASHQSGAADETSPDPQARLEVINHSSYDMDIFVVRGGQRLRIGLAPNNDTTRFSLATAQIAGAGLLHFEAKPTLGDGPSVSSEPISVVPRDVITMTIPAP
jgi:hypothetical protein